RGRPGAARRIVGIGRRIDLIRRQTRVVDEQQRILESRAHYREVDDAEASKSVVVFGLDEEQMVGCGVNTERRETGGDVVEAVVAPMREIGELVGTRGLVREIHEIEHPAIATDGGSLVRGGEPEDAERLPFGNLDVDVAARI